MIIDYGEHKKNIIKLFFSQKRFAKSQFQCCLIRKGA